MEKSEEAPQQKQQKDQDAKKQCDQAFAMISLVRISESKLMAFKNAQQADLVLMKLLE